LLEFLSQPWPWYVSGPLIGLMVPAMLIFSNKRFGISSSLRHLCAIIPNKNPFFNYDWRKEGGWNLVFAAGIILGGFVGGVLLRGPEPVMIAAATQADIAQLGVRLDGELMPLSLFSWQNLFTLPGFILMVVGGFLVGFGARYADGCTSGHGITGTAMLQPMSFIALIGFFVGGLFTTHLLLPFILRL
jgi:uncharacterized protein